MRKFLRNFFWSHGALLGYLGSLSQKGHPEIFSKSLTNNRIVRRGTSPQGYLGAGPRVGTDGVGEYKTPGMRESIRADARFSIECIKEERVLN